jgi:hypothetical protein
LPRELEFTALIPDLLEHERAIQRDLVSRRRDPHGQALIPLENDPLEAGNSSPSRPASVCSNRADPVIPSCWSGT